jgi:hypothetical protein
MLHKFLQMQQDQLDALALEKQAQEQRRELERERYSGLKFFHDSLRQQSSTTALGFQNRTAMQTQLGILLDSQEQELVLSELELQATHKKMLAQFGKVKGLQGLQNKRLQVKRHKEKKQEQYQLDDWLGGRRNNR